VQERPTALSEGVYVERIEDECVVYNRTTETAHSLSAAAARVWDSCDGRHSADQLAEELRLAPELVWQALAELDECGLLQDDPVEHIDGITRRQAAKRLGKVGGLALTAPLIYSVTIGAASAAASPLTCDNQACIGSGSTMVAAQADASTQCAVAPGCQAASTCENGSVFSSSGETFYEGVCQY
jgi:Coenzyme PQQ synthesis protein D (PqqD)